MVGRILIVRSQLRFSGTTERMRASVAGLIDAGWEVHVLAGPGARSREIEESGATLHVDRPDAGPWSAPFVRLRARRLFDRIGAEVALVIGNDLAPLAAHLRRPHVFELDRPPVGRLPWNRAYLRGVIVPCATVIEAVVNRGRLPRELVHILAHAPEGPSGLRPALTGDGPVRLGAAGGLESGLGAEALLAATRSLLDNGHELELILLGEGPAEDAIRRRARELAIERNVTITAPAGPSTAELLAQLDVFVCPQPVGTPGWLTAEALALGRPCLLASNKGSFQWVEDRVDGYLVDRTDPAELTRCLGEVLADPDAARALGMRARERWSHPEPYGARLCGALDAALATQ